jgi:MSHA biogenesis protein MshE
VGLIKSRKNAPEGDAPSAPEAGASAPSEPKANFVATDANLEAAPRHRGVRIGDLLRERGLVSDEQIEAAVAEQKDSGKRLGVVLVEMGLIAERDLATVLADQLGLDVVDLRHASLDPEVVALLPESVARELHAIPIGRKGPHLEIAVGDPLMPELLNRLIQATESPVRMVVAGVSDIELAIDRSYKSTAKVDL